MSLAKKGWGKRCKPDRLREIVRPEFFDVNQDEIITRNNSLKIKWWNVILEFPMVCHTNGRCMCHTNRWCMQVFQGVLTAERNAFAKVNKFKSQVHVILSGSITNMGRYNSSDSLLCRKLLCILAVEMAGSFGEDFTGEDFTRSISLPRVVVISPDPWAILIAIRNTDWGERERERERGQTHPLQLPNEFRELL